MKITKPQITVDRKSRTPANTVSLVQKNTAYQVCVRRYTSIHRANAVRQALGGISRDLHMSQISPRDKPARP